MFHIKAQKNCRLWVWRAPPPDGSTASERDPTEAGPNPAKASRGPATGLQRRAEAPPGPAQACRGRGPAAGAVPVANGTKVRARFEGSTLENIWLAAHARPLRAPRQRDAANVQALATLFLVEIHKDNFGNHKHSFCETLLTAVPCQLACHFRFRVFHKAPVPFDGRQIRVREPRPRKLLDQPTKFWTECHRATADGVSPKQRASLKRRAITLTLRNAQLSAGCSPRPSTPRCARIAAPVGVTRSPGMPSCCTTQHIKLAS